VTALDELGPAKRVKCPSVSMASSIDASWSPSTCLKRRYSSTIGCQSQSTMLVKTSALSCVYLMWRKCSARLLLGDALAFLLPPSYHPTHHPLMFLRLYTHGFLMVYIVSALLVPKAIWPSMRRPGRLRKFDIALSGRIEEGRDARTRRTTRQFLVSRCFRHPGSPEGPEEIEDAVPAGSSIDEAVKVLIAEKDRFEFFRRYDLIDTGRYWLNRNLERCFVVDGQVIKADGGEAHG